MLSLLTIGDNATLMNGLYPRCAGDMLRFLASGLTLLCSLVLGSLLSTPVTAISLSPAVGSAVLSSSKETGWKGLSLLLLLSELW